MKNLVQLMDTQVLQIKKTTRKGDPAYLIYLLTFHFSLRRCICIDQIKQKDKRSANFRIFITFKFLILFIIFPYSIRR